MKSKIIIFLTFLIGCRISNDINFNKNISKKIFIAQDKNKIFANSAYWSRKEFINRLNKIDIDKSDTLFLIERIGEPDLDSWSHIWTSKREFVYEYRRDSGVFKDTVIHYKTWQNRYKDNVEQFDTTTIDKHKILGGYRTFMTQVIQGKEVKTFFFHDSYSSFNVRK